jgi:hypothetical protein
MPCISDGCNINKLLINYYITIYKLLIAVLISRDLVCIFVRLNQFYRTDLNSFKYKLLKLYAYVVNQKEKFSSEIFA